MDPNPLKHICSHGEEDERYQSGADVTIPDRWSAPVFGIINRSSYAFPFFELFTQSFVDQDIRIHSHSYGKDDSRHTAQW